LSVSNTHTGGEIEAEKKKKKRQERKKKR